MVSEQAAGLQTPALRSEDVGRGGAFEEEYANLLFRHLQARPVLSSDHSQLVVATVDVSGGTARLTDKRTVYESNSKACTIEAQDFFDDDKKMTFTCYEPQHLASAMTIDLASGKVENMSKAPGTYNECEGIYPDGQYTNVEGDRQVAELGGDHGSRNIDIWKLRLDGTGKDFKRLTHFNDYEGFKRIESCSLDRRPFHGLPGCASGG